MVSGLTPSDHVAPHRRVNPSPDQVMATHAGLALNCSPNQCLEGIMEKHRECCGAMNRRLFVMGLPALLQA